MRILHITYYIYRIAGIFRGGTVLCIWKILGVYVKILWLSVDSCTSALIGVACTNRRGLLHLW